MWTARLGALLVALGVVLLVLVSTPRRLMIRLAYARTAWKLQRDQDVGATQAVNVAMKARRTGGRIPVFGAALARNATRAGRWMTGR